MVFVVLYYCGLKISLVTEPSKLELMQPCQMLV